jgi:phage terminase small subunit
MAVPEEVWGELGPAMRALPNDKWRTFVDFYILEKPGRGAQTNAARRAGFGKARTKAMTMARISSRLMRDDRIVAAIAEETRKVLRGGAPEAAKAILNLIRDPDHKDHARAIAMVMDRVDPITSHQQIEVTHKMIDPDQDAIEELRALRKLGASHEKLIELFGHNGLERVEALEAADAARRADAAKIIDAKVIEPEEMESVHNR